MRNHFRKNIEEQLSELEEKLRQTSFELYKLASGKHRFKPLYGKVVVRVLPKEYVSAGGIVIPETTQTNKPVYEGLVVEIWKPWVEERQVKRNGKIETDYIHHRCPVQVGDRIAFPHYLGVPVGSYLDDKYYRIIPLGDEPTEVLGIIDFHGDYEAKQTIIRCTAKINSVTTSGVSASRGANMQEVAR